MEFWHLIISYDVIKLALKPEHFLNAEKSVGGHVKKSITLSFFNRIKFCLAVRCSRFQLINV